MSGMKKLYRSDSTKIIFGILGGLGEYFDVDPVLLRAIFIFVLVFSGFLPAILVYLLAALIIPRGGRDNPPTSEP